MKDFAIPMNGFIGWECKYCGACVLGEINENTGIIEPVSKYWNLERKEVYCCAEHSLLRHEELKTPEQKQVDAVKKTLKNRIVP